MAKELPYFRFTCAEWLNDDISMENYEIKGVYIDVCAWYWFKDCSITIAMLKKRFKDAIDIIEQLIELNLIKVTSEDENVEIKFLNEQYDVLSQKRKSRVEAGRAGGLKKSSNAKAKLKQKSSYKDNNKDKDNYKDKINIIYPFDSEKFLKAWEYWKDYKLKEHNFKYKSEKSEQMALKKLSDLSNTNEDKCISIIRQSIENGWKGFFDVKSQSNSSDMNNFKHEILNNLTK